MINVHSKYTLVFLLFLGTFGCKNHRNGIDISDFYFPRSSMGETITNEYLTIKAGKDTQLMKWHYSSIGENLLSAKGYNQHGQILQERSERIISTGIELSTLKIYMPDSTGQYHEAEAGIIYDDVFPFQVKENEGVYLYKIELPDPTLDGVVRTITRNRRYLGDTTLVFEGEPIHGVIFDYKESIEDIREGRLTLDFFGQETYLRGIGLYERIRNYEDSLFDIVRLKTISRVSIELGY